MQSWLLHEHRSRPFSEWPVNRTEHHLRDGAPGCHRCNDGEMDSGETGSKRILRELALFSCSRAALESGTATPVPPQ
jgi:hypothetical protein